jgi:Transposase
VKKSKYSEEQIVRILKEVAAGAKVGETCRKHRLSEPTDPCGTQSSFLVRVSVTVLTTFSAAKQPSPT